MLYDWTTAPSSLNSLSMMVGSHRGMWTRSAPMERNHPYGCSRYCFHPSQVLSSLACSPSLEVPRLFGERTNKEVATFLWLPPLSFRGMQVGRQCWRSWCITAEKDRTPISNIESDSCYSQPQASAHAGSGSQASVWTGLNLFVLTPWYRRYFTQASLLSQGK